jgi:gag-polyprotein putative aspartyl protease
MTKKPVATASLVFCLAAIACARSPINLDALQRDGYGVVPIKHLRPNELVIRAMINDRAVSLILDTGWSGRGSGISLDRDLARALKVQAAPVTGAGRTWTGATTGNEMVALGNSIVMGNAKITGVPLYFGNYTGLHSHTSFTPTGERIVYESKGERGFITIGFLRATSAIIDLANFQLYLRPPGTGRRAMLGQALKEIGFAEIPLSGVTDRHFVVDVEINGASGKMVLDTGTGVTVVDQQFASKAKLGRRSLKMYGGDAAGNFRQSEVGNVQSFKVGGVLVYRPDVSVTSTALGNWNVAGLIGMDILGQNRGIIDCGAQKLYLVKGVH